MIASSLNPFFTLFLRFPTYSLGKGRICILSVSFAHFSCQFLNTGRPEFKFWAFFPTLAYPCPLADLTSSFRYVHNSGLFSLQTRPLPEHRTAFSTFPLGYLIGFLNLTLSKNTYVYSSPIFISENDTIIFHSIFLGLFLISLFLSPLHPVQAC